MISDSEFFSWKQLSSYDIKKCVVTVQINRQPQCQLFHDHRIFGPEEEGFFIIITETSPFAHTVL